MWQYDHKVTAQEDFAGLCIYPVLCFQLHLSKALKKKDGRKFALYFVF